MSLFYITLLIFLGLLFLVAELLLLPGTSIGGFLALICYGSSVYLTFINYGPLAGGLVIGGILVVSLIATVISLRAKTWQRFSLKQKINSSSMPATPDQELKIGDLGTTVSRLCPMGKIDVGGQIFEAKSTGAYIDPQQEVEVVGFENFSVIVKTTTK